MKRIQVFALTMAFTAALTLIPGAHAKDKEKEKPKAYPLKTCLVTDEKLDSDPNMKSYTFVHEGQELKLCCKSCLKDFNKNPKTYLKKLKDPKKS